MLNHLKIAFPTTLHTSKPRSCAIEIYGFVTETVRIFFKTSWKARFPKMWHTLVLIYLQEEKVNRINVVWTSRRKTNQNSKAITVFFFFITESSTLLQKNKTLENIHKLKLGEKKGTQNILEKTIPRPQKEGILRIRREEFPF